MTAPRLLVITDLATLPARELLPRAERIAGEAAPGSVAVLLRDHAASVRVRLALGHELLRITRAARQELWVADRLDLALLLGAEGVHLGEGSVSAATARRLLGERIRISRAWHTRSLEPRVELEQASALVVSPILAERKGRPPLGLPALAEFSQALVTASPATKVYALGGIGPEQAAACLAAGAWGVAAIGAAWTGDYGALIGALGIRRASV